MAIMDITVTMLSGTSQTLSVRPEDTVGYLKQLIQESMGVPVHKQRLVVSNGQQTQLNDNSLSLGHYGLHSGSRVSLLVIEPEFIQVFLRNEKGTVTTYDIKPQETVDEFKTKVKCREGVPESQQRLVYQGREMNAGKLSDYKVEALSTIDLLMRLRGGQ